MQTYEKLAIQCLEYNKQFEKIEFAPLQKAFIAPHFLDLAIRFPGKSLHLFLGLGERYEGVFFSEVGIPSFVRQKDRFLDLVRKHLVGSRLGKIIVDPHFRRIRIPYKRNDELNHLDLMWLERSLYFAISFNDQDKKRILKSWANESTLEKNPTLTEVFSEFTSQVDPKSGDAEFDLKKYLKDIQGQRQPGMILSPKKKKKFLEKKIANIESDLRRFSEIGVVKLQLQNDELELLGRKFDLCGVKVKFNEDEYYKKKNTLFQKIKSIDSAITVLKVRLKETEEELSEQKDNISFDKIAIPVVQPVWKTGKNITKSEDTAKINSLIFETKSGLKIEISLDAKSNDLLRKFANKDHYWFHLENVTGAHLIAKTSKLEEIKKEDFEIIASCLAEYSKHQFGEADLMYAQVKEVKGAKGTVGMALVKKPKYLRAKVNLGWKAGLK